MKKIFGLDGIRGKANSYPMTPEMALRIGKAAAKVFRKNHKRHKIVIGKDTRLSGYILETALTSGICSMGVDVYLVGPMPTPAVAHLTKSLCADASIMITASHNPAEDNGIKFFSKDGFKLDKKTEGEIEKELFSEEISSNHITGDKMGKAFRVDDAPGRYIEYVKSSAGSFDLSNVKVVIDCANGAGYSVGPKILKELGANVIVIYDKPDGLNINMSCGSTHLDALKKAVIENKADIGIALDGDADRCLMVDEKGEEFDGDFIMGLVAQEFKKKNKLNKNTIVGTVMSNMGLEIFCKKLGIELVRTNVGDKYVIREMNEKGYNFGGEQSGHIIFFDYGTSGDGIMTGVQILKILKESGKKLSELRVFEKMPQVLINVDVKDKKDFAKLLKDKMLVIEKEMQGKGRVFIRNSDTQNICRVMVEGEDKDKIQKYAEDLSERVKKL